MNLHGFWLKQVLGVAEILLPIMLCQIPGYDWNIWCIRS